MKLYLLQNKIFREPKKLLVLALVIFGFILFGIKIFSTRVTAQIVPVEVSEVSLDFGTVFPGEEMSENFVITFVQQYEQDNVTYNIIKKPKPFWPKPTDCSQTYTTIEEARAYCLTNATDLKCCYPDLCSFLTPVKVVEGTESDTPDSASVGRTDLSDTWTIYFKVPAIVGTVAQEHDGGVVTAAGDYGCDVSINIPEIP